MASHLSAGVRQPGEGEIIDLLGKLKCSTLFPISFVDLFDHSIWSRQGQGTMFGESSHLDNVRQVLPGTVSDRVTRGDHKGNAFPQDCLRVRNLKSNLVLEVFILVCMQCVCLPVQEIFSKEYHGMVANSLHKCHWLYERNCQIRLNTVVDHIAGTSH